MNSYSLALFGSCDLSEPLSLRVTVYFTLNTYLVFISLHPLYRQKLIYSRLLILGDE